MIEATEKTKESEAKEGDNVGDFSSTLTNTPSVETVLSQLAQRRFDITMQENGIPLMAVRNGSLNEAIAGWRLEKCDNCVNAMQFNNDCTVLSLPEGYQIKHSWTMA